MAEAACRREKYCVGAKRDVPAPNGRMPLMRTLAPRRRVVGRATGDGAPPPPSPRPLVRRRLQPAPAAVRDRQGWSPGKLAANYARPRSSCSTLSPMLRTRTQDRLEDAAQRGAWLPAGRVPCWTGGLSDCARIAKLSRKISDLSSVVARFVPAHAPYCAGERAPLPSQISLGDLHPPVQVSGCETRQLRDVRG